MLKDILELISQTELEVKELRIVAVMRNYKGFSIKEEITEIRNKRHLLEGLKILRDLK
jgi:hypothetical protein